MMTIDPIEYEIMTYELQEAYEAFTKLREDYHALREHTDELEAILSSHGLPYSNFCGW